MTSWFFQIHSPRQILYPSLLTEKDNSDKFRPILDQFKAMIMDLML